MWLTQCLNGSGSILILIHDRLCSILILIHYRLCSILILMAQPQSFLFSSLRMGGLHCTTLLIKVTIRFASFSWRRVRMLILRMRYKRLSVCEYVLFLVCIVHMHFTVCMQYSYPSRSDYFGPYQSQQCQLF